MSELIELQTGQVAFLSGLLAGFAMTAALHILRHGMRDKASPVVFLYLYSFVPFIFGGALRRCSADA